MPSIPDECRRMADIYRQFCQEFGIPANIPPAESLSRMTISIFIQGARGPGEPSAVRVPLSSTPGPAKGAGQLPAPDGGGSAVPVETPSLDKESHGKPAAVDNRLGDRPQNPDLSEKQINWLWGHGWTKEAIEKMSKKEGYMAINKAMKGGR